MSGDAKLDTLQSALARAQLEHHASPSPQTLQRALDAGCTLVVALVEDLDDEGADRLLETIAPLLGVHPVVEIATRRKLASELAVISAHDRARSQLRLARARAHASGYDEVARELEAILGPDENEPKAPRGSGSLREAAAAVLDPALASVMERSLSSEATGEQALYHAQRSLERAYASGDEQLVAEATSVLCELLIDSDALVEAKRLLDERPLTGDSRLERAMYDEIRRRLGEPLADPPDEPDEPAQLAPAIRAYFTKPYQVARSICEGALPGAATVREWASGPVTSIADLESQKVFGPVRSFWCMCGRLRGREYKGLTCPRCGVDAVNRSARRTRTGFITLAYPMLHPWYTPAAAALLEIELAQVLALPVEALRDRLDALDLDALAARCKQDIITAPKARLADAAGRLLALVDAFRQAREAYATEPRSIILEVVLVPPPEGDYGFDRPAYAALLTNPSAITSLFR